MTKRKNNFAARLGSLFGKKPERHVTPHIYVSTESDVKERKAKAKERAKRRAASKEASAAPAVAEAPPDKPTATDAAPTKGLGKLLKAANGVRKELPSEDVEALKEEEGFMQRVQLRKTDTAPRNGIDFWTMLKGRLGRDAPPMRAASTEKVEIGNAGADTKTEKIDASNDTFLRRASAIPADSAREKEVPETASALDEVAGAVEPAQRNAARKAKEEVTKALRENADIREEPAPASPEADVPAPAPKAERPKPAKKKIHAPQFQAKKGFSSFLTSLGYIGMGKERQMFIQNMATMLNAGLPLTDALKTMVLETRNRSMRKLDQRIIDMVENGSPLWRAMEAQNFFSLHALALVRIGEEAGNLAENMGYLAEQDEKDHALRSKVKMAMIYPTIVMVIMFVIIVGLGMFVLPNLVGVLFSLNVELPLVTRIVIWCSDMFTTHGAVGIPSFMAGFALLMILSKYTSLRVVTQWVMFRIPGIGRLAREATIARFGVILGGLLKAGVPVVEALESLVQVTPIQAYRNLYAQMLARITIGDSFSKCFASIKGSHKLLPPSVQQLVITGEKSGSLADITLKIADIYDKKASETAEKLPIILEPMLLLFIGGLVGSIAFAIIIPIYSIVGNVGGA